VHGNATATANNIAAHETLFRFGIAGDLFTGTMVIFVALAFYRLFKGVDQNQAVLMVILGGVLPSAIYFFNVLNDAAALMLARGADFLSVFEKTSAGRAGHAVSPSASPGKSLPQRSFGVYGFFP